MRTGDSPETVAIEPVVSGWPERDVLGSPLVLSRERIIGTGRITGHFASAGVSSTSFCSRGGPPADGAGVDSSLPGQSTTTLRYDVKLTAPPWPSKSMSLAVRAGIPAMSPDPSVIQSYSLGNAPVLGAGPERS